LPLKKNINISPPIMSRFDLFFIICDESDDLADSYLSEFLVGMHTNKKK
jgi:DNA replication licensing factor MCM6